MFAVKSKKITINGLGLTASAMLVLLSVTACNNGSKEKASGQSLARVNGQEITVLQLNEELSRLPADQRASAGKPLLESLIDRQLLQSEAARDKVDRDPVVMQAIERAKAQIVAQAYMQSRIARVARPTKEEIDKYYNDHPDFFASRKIFELEQLIVATRDFNGELKTHLNSFKSIEEVAVWLKEHHVEFVKNTEARNTVELPAPLVAQLKLVHKGQLFALQKGEQSVVVSIADVKDSPVKLDAAETQIGTFLQNQRNKEAGEAEVARLRASAKIEYLNKSAVETGALSNVVPAESKQKNNEEKTGDDHIKRGVSAL